MMPSDPARVLFLPFAPDRDWLGAFFPCCHLIQSELWSTLCLVAPHVYRAGASIRADGSTPHCELRHVRKKIRSSHAAARHNNAYCTSLQYASVIISMIDCILRMEFPQKPFLSLLARCGVYLVTIDDSNT